MLNLVWVRTFLALAKHKSFQAAADCLRIAQPTASSHIQKLEHQLGVPLFHRSRTGCEPTREAMNFLPYAQSILRVNERALAAVSGERLRIGASSNIGIYLLQPYVRSYLEGRDPSAFDIVIDRNPSIAEKLENVEIDVAVLEWWDSRDGCQAECWKSEPVVVIVPPDHPLASQARISRAELSELELLGGEPGTGTGRMLAKYFGDGASTAGFPSVGQHRSRQAGGQGRTRHLPGSGVVRTGRGAGRKPARHTIRRPAVTKTAVCRLARRHFGHIHTGLRPASIEWRLPLRRSPDSMKIYATMPTGD